ncbi:Zinc iron permease [Lecanosticta acicola]|uniref:Zinc iron permease n=1 Tax=Lecanosticta acicola TaxID=111012 RepID=A0AAI9EDR6_9PEZI|nr:Zinc iron permease [Lecanosticta acicola]
MWDGLFMLLFLSIVMGVASFLAGSLPLSFSLSSRQRRIITALGTGILVGTSLIVIIPEGAETLYSASGVGHRHNARGLALNSRSGAMQNAVEYEWTAQKREPFPLAYDSNNPGRVDKDLRTGPDDGHQSAEDAAKSNPTSSDQGHEPGVPVTGGHSGSTSGSASDADTADYEPHAWIGISLILGFILMYLIDTIPQTATSSTQPQRFHISLNQFSFDRTPSLSNENAGPPAADTMAASSTSAGASTRPSSTTVGLVIHAAADGIALGASSTAAGSHLSFIIFIALMIHKAPAAFGLTSVLLKQGLSKRMARAHLIVFSLAAPVGALLTWAAVHLLGFSSSSLGESASTEFVTGVLLLFSGGTFLYVAMHTMQENGSDDHAHEPHAMNGYAGVPMDDPYTAHVAPPSKSQGPMLTDTLITVGGMLLPLLTQWGHSH